MRNWEEKDLKYIHNSTYFPNCIECANDPYSMEEKQYFHKSGCERGLKDWDETNRRLNKRLEIFEKKYGKTVKYPRDTNWSTNEY